jgi:hypothetical protein
VAFLDELAPTDSGDVTEELANLMPDDTALPVDEAGAADGTTAEGASTAAPTVGGP